MAHVFTSLFVLTGPSLHSGLNVPPTASQAFVPGEASGDDPQTLAAAACQVVQNSLQDLFHITITRGGHGV